MPKIPDCTYCLLYAHNPHLVYAIQSDRVESDRCLNFREDPNAPIEELWQLEGASYYNGELIVQPGRRWGQPFG
ncbi:MAG: hypothetical protein V7K40_33315 [Nostoc sp.]|uniref:hypothetical protein n=1 Tax=Nostoc sp. TaxID=1180 RepID=UPI002FF925EA